MVVLLVCDFVLARAPAKERLEATGMCLGGHLVGQNNSESLYIEEITSNPGFPCMSFKFNPYHIMSQALKAAFDPRIMAAVCFFATDIHSATLGKGKNDDTLIRVRRGDLTRKGEITVSQLNY